MKRYKLQISPQADDDLDDLSDTIVYKYKSPKTAVSYLRSVRTTIKGLRTFHNYARCPWMAHLYGPDVRRVSHGNTSIIFSVHGDTVYVHRVMPSSQVKGEEEEEKREQRRRYGDDEED